MCKAYHKTNSANCSPSSARRPTACPRTFLHLESSEIIRRCACVGFSFARSRSARDVLHRVDQAGFFEAFQPEHARIAMTARATCGIRIITTVRQRIVDPKFRASLDDLSFG